MGSCDPCGALGRGAGAECLDSWVPARAAGRRLSSQGPLLGWDWLCRQARWGNGGSRDEASVAWRSP